MCGPFLGEPGFETLYWIPFLRKVVTPLLARGHEAVIISRGGVEPLYADMLAQGAEYLDVLDVFSLEEFIRLERERVGSNPRAKNQKRTGEFDRRVLAEAGHGSSSPLLPSHMFELLERYPYATLCDWRGLPPPPDRPRDDVTLIKLWFGGQLPATDETVRRLERWVEHFADQGPVAAMVNRHTLELSPLVDGPFEQMVERIGIPVVDTTSPRTNMGDQVELVSRSRRFVASYGGLAYLSIYTATPLISFYTDPTIVFSRHFLNFTSALSYRNTKASPGLSFSLIDVGST